MLVEERETELNENPPAQPSTTVVYRPGSAIAGIRLVQDDALRITVLGLPFSEIPRLTASCCSILDRERTLASASAYLLSNREQIYIGETGKTLKRLREHAVDPEKRWVTDVYVVSTFDTWLDKPGAIFMQRTYNTAAKHAGLMHVVEGSAPAAPRLTAQRAAAVGRMAEDAYPLLFDAGLRAFHSGGPHSDWRSPLASDGSPTSADDDEEDNMMKIDASLPTDALGHYQLRYGKIWAHGYAYREKFVLGIGSDVRTEIQPSANPIYRERRRQLLARGALAPIPLVEDRLRLIAPIAVPSPSIAAKLACGAHVTAGLWKAA